MEREREVEGARAQALLLKALPLKRLLNLPRIGTRKLHFLENVPSLHLTPPHTGGQRGETERLLGPGRQRRRERGHPENLHLHNS